MKDHLVILDRIVEVVRGDAAFTIIHKMDGDYLLRIDNYHKEERARDAESGFIVLNKEQAHQVGSFLKGEIH